VQGHNEKLSISEGPWGPTRGVDEEKHEPGEMDGSFQSVSNHAVSPQINMIANVISNTIIHSTKESPAQNPNKKGVPITIRHKRIIPKVVSI
jgi:hypothetical protein